LALINDILDLSKIESGKMQLEADQVDLHKVVNGSIRMFREKAMKESISLECELDESIRFIEADKRKLKQILFNLLSNAIKFTPAEGRVQVRMHGGSSIVRISVKDSGCGIPQGQFEQVFENFFQVDAELTKSSEGTGLGLPLVRQIAELHSGKAWCESSDENGSCFIVELPIEQALSAEASQQMEASVAF
jgi:signal transduction histidine kinase